MDRVLRRRWGESSLHAGIGFERELTVRVDANRVTVGNQPAIAAGQGELPAERAERVAAAIDDEAQAWGRPPENFYWVPTLRFVVTPGGNRHSERLRGRLNLYGLDSTVDYRLDTAEPSVLPPLQTRTATAGEGGP